jgi:hypothetical protein
MQAVVSPFNILQTGNTWKLFASSDNTNWDYNATTLATTSLTTGQWYHIAVVRYNGTLKLYVDGTVAGTVNSFNINLKRDQYNRFVNVFGNWQSDGGSTGLNGYVSDYRITKYARYTSNFTPPTAALKKF